MPKPHNTPELTVTRAVSAPPLDGSLDGPIWGAARPHQLLCPATEADAAPTEGGSVRVLYDEQRVYVGVAFADRDVVQEDDQDQRFHFRTGDVAETFLKPAGASHYWELYVTPNGRKTSLFFPSRGRLGLPSAMTEMPGLHVAAKVDGTLNDWQDEDRGWTAVLSIPLAALAAHGVAPPPVGDWTVLVARYNYGRQLPKVELSSFPRMPRAAWHDHEHWARLVASHSG